MPERTGVPDLLAGHIHNELRELGLQDEQLGIRSASLDFLTSAHWARGYAQNETYEYIGGFSLASDICARAGGAQQAAIASTPNPAKILQLFPLSIFLSSSVL